jgi:hypothetical protein
MPPELERARNWLRPRSVRSGFESPTTDGAICRAARRIFRAVARSRVIGIASPCLSALRLERALPTAVLGPRLRAPLRRFAAICLSVAILMITIGGYRQLFEGCRLGRRPFSFSVHRSRRCDFLTLSFLFRFSAPPLLYMPQGCVSAPERGGAPSSDAVQILSSSQEGLNLNFSWFN